MFSKLNQYLLTNYPLLWNTRVVQLLLANAVIHLLYFLAGYFSFNMQTIQFHYYYEYSFGLLSFSILCSIAVLVLWLVFYLRNNALKQFYRLGQWHLVKEWGLILLALFTSITYFESFQYGERKKARSITSLAQLRQEANAINLAMAFIPINKEDYFILHNCEAQQQGNIAYRSSIDYSDTLNFNNNDSDFVKIRKALRLPNAFSYQHYCQVFVALDDTAHYRSSRQINATVADWLGNNRQDSVAAAIQQCLAICKRYDISASLSPQQLAAWPFGKPYHNIGQMVNTGAGENMVNPSPYYINTYNLNRAMEYLSQYHSDRNTGRYWDRLLAHFYFAFGFGLLLLCYRRFSKKVFLISLVGAAVWCIVFGLIGGMSGGPDGIFALFVLLFVAFAAMALAGLYGKMNKTVAGVALIWHLCTVPVCIMATAALISYHYSNMRYEGVYDEVYDAVRHCSANPIGCWVDNNITAIAWANLLIALLYISFVGNRLTKKWQSMPDE
jgi:hypothetical protein